MTLSNILTHVDPNLFGKIRSSCIVNLEYVQEVVRDELLLKNGESLFVSRMVLCQEKVQIKYNQFSLFM